MPSVTLDFVQPQEPDLVALKIYESETREGAFAEIERVTEVGTYPDYISRYTTEVATNPSDWFSIAWENNKGVVGPLSVAVQGNVDNYVAQLVDRILLRDPSVKEGVAVEEAEAVLWMYLKEDPYTTEKFLNSNELSGLTYIALGRIYTFTMAVTSTAGDKYTAGIVSQGGGTTSTSSGASVKDLFDLGGRILGLSQGVIAQMGALPVVGNGGGYGYAVLDESRLLIDAP